jgi:hypothetical protein
MKSTIFWDITPYSPLSINRRFGKTYCLHLQCRNWRWSRYVSPKCRLTLYGLHGVISQKMDLFMFLIILRSAIIWGVQWKQLKLPQCNFLSTFSGCPSSLHWKKSCRSPWVHTSCWQESRHWSEKIRDSNPWPSGRIQLTGISVPPASKIL